MDTADLLRRVEARFAVTGADTQPWPAPHPDRAPYDEEYSRLLDPGKYRILAARFCAWGDVLVDRALAVRASIDPADAPAAVADLRADRVERLDPLRPGALTVLACFHEMDGVPEAALDLGVGEPWAPLESLPHCGCDACDDGSEALLEELDEAILHVVAGGFIRVDLGGAHVQTTLHGWVSEGDRSSSEIDAALVAARAGRSPYPVLRGERWW